MRAKVLTVACAVLFGVVGSLPSSAQRTSPGSARPQVCDAPTRSVTLYAVPLGRGRVGYGYTPQTAKVPGPTLEMIEGECLAVTLVNRTTKLASVHAHGVDYTVASDGTRLNRSCVKPGGRRTYVFQAHAASTRADGSTAPSSAGYWHYHDHCRGTFHGTGGIEAGLFGALIVRRPNDPVPDRRPFVVVMGPGTTINTRRAPRTPTFRANVGDRVEFVVIGHGHLLHTFHLHGHRWVDNRTGIPSGLNDPTPIIDNRTLGPGDSFGLQVIAGEGVGPGAWMYHCHVQDHSDSGMAGIFLVRDEDGNVTRDARAVLSGWRAASTHDHH
jgi:FtsP/CotA-like multicopper oxidase with cupredoxin domain